MQQQSSVTSLIVAGDEIGGAGVATVDVTSPWDGRLVGAVPWLDADAARTAIDGAWDAMQAGLTAAERAVILDRVAVEIGSRREEFGAMISAENGKPLKQALAEADRCVQTLIFSGAEARSVARRGVPLDAHPAGAGHLRFTSRHLY